MIDSDFNENTSSSDDLGEEKKKVVKFERDPDLFVMDVEDLLKGKCNFDGKSQTSVEFSHISEFNSHVGSVDVTRLVSIGQNRV